MSSYHKAEDHCFSCGSDNISKDYETESIVCNDCGSSQGGANFWQ